MGNVAAYVRVSSASQTLKTQRDAIERCAASRGDAIEVWYDEKVSAATLQRPELGKLRAAIRAGHIGRLYVHRLDRLARSGIRDTLDLVQEIERGGAQLVTVGDGLDLAGPARDVVLSVLAWAAQMERDAIGERIRAARARIEAKGGSWGRPRSLTEAQIATARAMRDAGKTLRAIAVKLGVPHSTLSRSLRLVQKPGRKWGPRALAKSKLRRLQKKGVKVDLRKTKGVL